jgi:hypothetical protein
MVMLNAVDEDDVCEGKEKPTTKEARKHWESFLVLGDGNLKRNCEWDRKLNEQAAKYGHYSMYFRGTFMDRDGHATLRFYEHRLYEVSMFFDDSSESTYYDLLRLLRARYGPPEERKQGENPLSKDLNMRSAWWALWRTDRDVTNIYLSQAVCKQAHCPPFFPDVEFSDLKTSRIAHERAQQYYREVGKK